MSQTPKFTYNVGALLTMGVVLVVWFIAEIHGLQCHTCMFVGGVLTDLKCKDAVHLDQTRSTIRPCNSESDALNGKDIQSMNPDAKFKVGCLKALIKTEEVDILIRGCYGREQQSLSSSNSRNSNSRYSSSTTWNNKNNVCESPGPSFWKKLRDGPLKNAKKPLDITKAILEVCLCSDGDGCNSGIKQSSKGLIILVSALLALVVGN